jgi:ankyrin repeat protein
MASQMNSKEFINTSIVHSSLKYLKVFNIVKLSKWINEELIKINYSDLKLEKALEKKDLELIKEIIYLNVDKNILNKYLIKYKYYKNYELVKLLLENGADVHVENDCSLRWASCCGHDKVVKILLENGADVHADDDKALRLASYYGHDKVIKLLLENGADIHSNNDYALRFASNFGYDKIVRLLLENGADTACGRPDLKVCIHATNDKAIGNL